MVVQRSEGEHRQKVSLSLDSSTLKYIDAYVAAHPATNRSRVVGEAIREFRRRQIDAELERQYDEPEPASVQKELDAWRAIRRASAIHAARRH
jgi:Arc/MetJ-type ribon-helix-helix transcriptional regulator